MPPKLTSSPERRFRDEWLGRLNPVLGVVAGVVSVLVVPQSTAPGLTAAALALYIVWNILHSYLELTHEPKTHMRAWGNAITVGTVAWSLTPSWVGALIAVPTMFGAMFSPRRWQTLYIVVLTIAGMSVGMTFGGVAPFEIAAAVVLNGIVATLASFFYVPLREAVFTAQHKAMELEASEAALEARKNLLATMSHEIRTPMNGVFGMVELLRATELTAEQREMLKVIRSSGVGLLQVIDDVLDLSKLDAGRMTLEQIPYRPRRVADEVVTVVRNAYPSARVAYLVTEEGLPEAVLGDPMRVRQILLNLVGNAAKFTARGKIEVRMRWSQSRLHVEVEDTGAGIDEAVQADLFQPFTQADTSTSRKHGGTGLGLAICHHLVALMGGRIALASTLGKGSTFTFDIEAPATARIASRSQSTPLEPLPAPPRVLLVDDNPVNLKVAERLLQRLGCKVVCANSGQSALERFESRDLDLVLMDCQMPGMDGFEATRALRLEDQRTPILALTAGVTAEERDRCLDAGMNSVIAKPVSTGALRNALAEWWHP